MTRTLFAAALCLVASVATAQNGAATYSRSTLAALSGVSGASGQAAGGYRTAARTGVGLSTGGAPVTAGGYKPFSGVSSGPTVSPYLNLFREGAETGAPNYYTFVRPMQDQYETNRQQVAQLQRLQRQVQQATYNATPTGVSGGARFGYTGGYFGGVRR
jgi:hypothetical protein